MDDKDHVFARFQDNSSSPADRDRELLTIPRRRGATGSSSRVVEVVHMRPHATGKDRPRRLDPQVRAVTWEGGFPARQERPGAGPMPEFAAATALDPKPTAHVMPMWEPPATRVAEPPPPPPEAAISAAVPRATKQERRVADPFDSDDAGANCIRCGYRIELARERRGAMTCAACG